MWRWVLAVIFTCTLSVPAGAGTIPITGTIRLPNGNLLNGSIRFTLSVSEARDTSANNVIVAQRVTFPVQNGSIRSGSRIVPNDVLSPSNTIYTAEYFTAAGTKIGQNNFAIQGASFDIGTATPTPLTTSNISFGVFTGLDDVTSKHIDNVRMCDQFAGATAGAKLAACIADIPSTGGIADARGLEGAQTSSVDPFSGVTKSVYLRLGGTTITTSVPWTMPGNSIIEGIGPITRLKASGAMTAVINATDKTGVILRDLTIDGNSAAPGIYLNNTTVGASTNNRVYRVFVENAATYGIYMDNNGDSTLEDVVIRNSASGAISVKWDDRGGNLNMTRVTAITANERTDLAFQTAVLEDCALRDIRVTFTSEQLRSVGGYYYAGSGGTVFKVNSSQQLRQADFIGTRFEITDASATGTAAIDGVFVTGLFMTNPKFGNAQNTAGRNVFGSSFGGPAGINMKLWVFGGTVDVDVANSPSFNPGGGNGRVLTTIENFGTAAGTIKSYFSTGPVGNDGTITSVVSAIGSGNIAQIIRGAASQTADLSRWQTSAGADLARVNNNGVILADSGILVGNVTGALISKIFYQEATWDPPNIAASPGTTSTTVTVTGTVQAQKNVVIVSHDQLGAAAAFIKGEVSADNTVAITLLNVSGGALDVASGLLKIIVYKMQ